MKSTISTPNPIASIAIIGMAGLFPGANTIAELWRKLSKGEELIKRWQKPVGAPDNYVPAVSSVRGYECFDAEFFGMSASDAELTDPQHRLFLESCWAALECAGYVASNSPMIGVFGGGTTSTYLMCNILSRRDIIEAVDPLQINIGNGADFLATRVSYKLNLKGPSHSVQCACSTSLVATHLACRSLLDRECDLALAGGTSVNLNLMEGYRYMDGGITSPDGYCRPFDARARGTVFGSGVGVVVLKRLEEAQADGDHIHAVILGSAVNNDGRDKVGYTAPSVEGQANVIAEAMAVAGVSPGDISYVECHGTATAVGDPIEVRALEKAFGRGRREQCAIGSIKGNLGHLDAAAGITGLIKVILSLKHRQIPPSLHFESANPQINFEENGFYVNTQLQQWSGNGNARRAGVSAFGVGGTNAHVVLQEAPMREASGESRRWQLVVCSGKTRKAERDVVEQLVDSFREEQTEKLADAAYTLAVGRQRFGFRRAVTCRNWQEAIERLQADESIASNEGEDSIGVGMLFSGQGTQTLGMGQQLFAMESVYKYEMTRCAELVYEQVGIDLLKVMEKGSEEDLQQTGVAQPILFATEYALARLWGSWGIRPVAMLGHSLGEYVAACLAGVMELADACRLVSVRGRLMEKMERGSMALINVDSDEDLSAWLGGELWLAAINGPYLRTVSGRHAAIDKLCREWKRRGKMAQRLRTSHAFHSPLMKPMVDEFVAEVAKTSLNYPQIQYISNLSGSWMGDECLNPQYWGEQLLQPVRFADGVNRLLQEERLALLEIGPGRQLTGMIRAHKPDARLFVSLTGADEQESMLKALAGLWCAGVEVSWTGFYESQKRHRITLPTYPFQRQRYWIDSQPPKVDPTDRASDIKATPIGQSSDRPSLRTRYVPPATFVERELASILEAALHVQPIGLDDRFGDLGGDSLQAVMIINSINSQLSCSLDVVDLYDMVTIRDLARYLDVDISFRQERK